MDVGGEVVILAEAQGIDVRRSIFLDILLPFSYTLVRCHAGTGFDRRVS